MARRAFLIANESFADPGIASLKSPVADTGRLAGLLGRPDVGAFEVTHCTNGNSTSLRREVQRFFALAEPDDLLFMLFSGHGIKDSAGRLHFASSDTELAALHATALDARFLQERMDESAARQKILFLDCCYSGAFGRGYVQKAIPPFVGRGEFGNQDSSGKVVITASTAIQPAFEDVQTSGQSRFTRYLIEGIETGRADPALSGVITVDGLYDYIHRSLRAESSENPAAPAQTPQRWYFGMEGNIALARNPCAGSPAAPEAGWESHPGTGPAATDASAGSKARPILRVLGWVPTVQVKCGWGTHSAAFSTDGARFATGSMDKAATIWDTESGARILELVGHRNSINSVAYSPDGAFIATASDDKTGRLWNSASGAVALELIGHRNSLTSIGFSSDGGRLVTSAEDCTIRLWDARSGRELSVLSLSRSAHDAQFSPDGRFVATGGYDDCLHLWDVASWKEVRAFSGHEAPVWSLRFSGDGARIVTCSSDSTARIWSTSSGEQLVRLRHDNDYYVGHVDFSPDAAFVATGTFTGVARVWDASDGRELATLKGHSRSVRAIFSPDGMRILTASSDGTACIWYPRF